MQVPGPGTGGCWPHCNATSACPSPPEYSHPSGSSLLFCPSVPNSSCLALALSPSSQCLLCVPLSGHTPLLVSMSPQLATATNLSDLIPSLSLPIKPVSHLCLWDCLTLQACASSGCGPCTECPWESSIPECPQTLRPNTTLLPRHPITGHRFQSSHPWTLNLPRGPQAPTFPLAEPPNLSNE